MIKQMNPIVGSQMPMIKMNYAKGATVLAPIPESTRKGDTSEDVSSDMK
jgi:hypothetical protein